MWIVIRFKAAQDNCDFAAFKSDLSSVLSTAVLQVQKDSRVIDGPGTDGGYTVELTDTEQVGTVKELLARHGFKVQHEQTLPSRMTDVDGFGYVWGDRMSIRQYYSHGGPGWDHRWHHQLFGEHSEVHSDEPYNG